MAGHWWDGDDTERYWMEITNRQDLGADLHAPKLNDSGRPYWSYNLVTDVRDRDIVLHWHKELTGTPAIVGWSTAVGAPQDSSIVWQARGTAGRAHGPTGAEPAWRMPLTDYTSLARPVDQNALRRAEPDLRRIHQQLDAQHRGPLYFPFAFSDKRAVRTAQGYLVKFPAAAVALLPELSVLPGATSARPGAAAPAQGPGSGDAGYQSDPRVRRAVELHAVAHATDYYTQLGYNVSDVGSTRPFDLLVGSPTETRHVEVKGSSGSATTVELTDGEVRQAADWQPTDLYLVRGITWRRQPDGQVSTDGGRAEVLHDWAPTPDRLAATRYRYTVPDRW